MTFRRLTLTAALFAFLLPGSLVIAADPEPLPTQADLRQMFTDAQYQPLLLKIARVLQLKGDPAKAYDRVELLLIRADSLLELKQASSAIQAIGDAMKAIDDQTDPKLAAQVRATSVLYSRMKVYVFTPKTAPKGEAPKPISLTDLTLRKAAFTALLGDLKLDVNAKVKSAKAGKSLTPIMEAARAAGDLRAVEIMATGEETESQKAVDSMADIAKTLTADGVKDLERQAKVIDASANKQVQGMANKNSNGSTTYTYSKQGLTGQNTKDLKSIIDTCQKIQGIAKDFAAASKSSAAGFKEVQDAADAVLKAATLTLNADYRGTTMR